MCVCIVHTLSIIYLNYHRYSYLIRFLNDSISSKYLYLKLFKRIIHKYIKQMNCKYTNVYFMNRIKKLKQLHGVFFI